MSKMKLFAEESEDENISLKTNNEYAKRYDNWREKEELHKLEQKYGPNALNSDASLSSDSEDESDEPPEVSEEMEAQFLKTLALLKTKDPRIYDPNFKFFENDHQKEEEKEPKIKQLTFDDSDDEDDDNDGNIFTIEKKALEIMNVEKNDEELKDKKVSKTANEKDGKLKEYLTGKVDHIDENIERDLAPLKALWSDPKLNEGEAFLRDYILNKRYLEEGGVGEAEDKVRDDEELEADEQRVEEQGQFERAYNFRFEEPDQEFLKRYPRTMNYIRPKDDKRSRVRAERTARKEEEKRKKMEEIARLKAFKLKEIQEKIARIKEVTGNQDLAFEEQDIEGDFDPEEHDRRMKAVFDEQYYGEADEEKPVFPDLDEELKIENWEKYEGKYDEEQIDGQNEDGPHCEDDDFNMDADYDPKKAKENLLEELKRNMGKKRRNRKKKSKLAQVLEVEKPKFVPTVTDKTYSEYMEEYYKMDCEDIIGGDLPTRFKYKEVVPNDYGLTVEEILLADDKELTQWVPLKKLVKYRPDHVEKGEVKTYAQKAADVKLKKKVLPSLFKNLPEEPEIVIPVEEANVKKKKKRKNKGKIEENGNNSLGNFEEIRHNDSEEIVENPEQIDDSSEVKSKKKKKKYNNQDINRENDNNLQEDNKQVGETSSKEKRKHKNGDFIIKNADNDVENQEDETIQVGNSKKEKKKNRNPEQNDQKNNLKRKLETKTDQVPQKKKKHKNYQNTTNKNAGHVNKNNNHNKKNKFKQKDNLNKNKNKSMDNSLDKLSDERLKAYGLNPKKYRGFLKYKKF